MTGSLSLDKLERLVVDASHIDQKKRGILDMKEITLPLTKWLARKEFKDKYVSDEKPLHLLFY
jgi:protein CMS1